MSLCLDDGQHGFLLALEDLSRVTDDGTKPSLRATALKHSVPRTTLQRASQKPAAAAAILSQSAGRGRKIPLTHVDECIIAETIVEFQNIGTPITRDLVLDIAQNYIRSLPISRRRAMNFRDERPGYTWLRGFLCRFPHLTLKTTEQLENERARAMSPQNIAEHFARVRMLMENKVTV